MPVGTSSTPGCATAPDTETSIVPGCAGSPTSRNQAAPRRAMSAEVGVGLGVGEQRRTSAYAGLEDARRDGDRQADALADEVRERALLAGDVARRGRQHAELDRVAAGALLDGALERADRAAAAVRDDVGDGRADGLRGEDRAVEDEVRVAVDEDRVLARRRLALHRVHDDDGVLARRARGGDDRVHLAPGREPAAAATGEAGVLDLGDQRAGVAALDLRLRGERAEHRDVLREVDADRVAEQPRGMAVGRRGCRDLVVLVTGGSPSWS